MRRCNHESVERYGSHYDERGIVEYSVRCNDCGKHIGTWSYGAWFEEDDDYDDEEEEEEE